MQLLLNGEKYQTEAHNINTLLTELELDSARVIILYNDVPIQKENWNTQILNDNDQLELLEFVGGG